MRMSTQVKQLTEKKKSYAILVDEIKHVTSAFKGTSFVIEIATDPESGEQSIIVKAVKSDKDWMDLYTLLTEAMLPIRSKSLKNGMRVIPMVELKDAHFAEA